MSLRFSPLVFPTLTVTLAVILLTAADVLGAQIFYSEGNNLLVGDTTSGGITTIYTGPEDGRPMVPYVTDEQIYWSTFYPGQLRRMDILGGRVETLVDQGDTTTRAIVLYGDMLYWANESNGTIYRSPLDFSRIDTVISGYFGYEDGIWDFAIHDDRIYWVGWDSEMVSSIALDGTGFRNFDGFRRAFSIEVVNDRIYLSDTETNGGRVLSMALDGTDRRILVENHRAVSITVFGDRLYYNDSNSGVISSIPLDGGVPSIELVAPGRPWQIFVIPEPAVGGLIALGTALALINRRRPRHLS